MRPVARNISDKQNSSSARGQGAGRPDTGSELHSEEPATRQASAVASSSLSRPDKRKGWAKPGADGKQPTVVRRQGNVRGIIINPERFTSDKILNMLDDRKLSVLQNEFDKIVREDLAKEKIEERMAMMAAQREKQAKLEEYNKRQLAIGFRPPVLSSKRGLPLLPQQEYLQATAGDPRRSMADVDEEGNADLLNEARKVGRAEDEDEEEVDGLTMGQFVRSMLRILTKPQEQANQVLKTIQSGEEKEKKFNVTKRSAALKPSTGLQEPTIEHDTPEFYDLVFGLCQLFEEIDINGDGTMEWTELMQFLMDTVNQRDQMTLDMDVAADKHSHADSESEEYRSNLSKISGATDFSYASDFSDVNKAKKDLKSKLIDNVLQTFLLSKYTKYHESETLVDRIIHKSPLITAIYSQKFGKYLLCEKDMAQSIIVAKQLTAQNTFQMTAAEKKKLKKMNAVMKDRKDMAQKIIFDYDIKPDFKKKAYIMSFAFSEKWQIMGLTASDGRIFFYKSKDKEFVLKQLFIIDASELTIQTRIWYVEKHDAWITAGKDNVLREWTINMSNIKSSGDASDNEDNDNDKSKNKVSQNQMASTSNQRFVKLAKYRKATLKALEEEYFHDGFLVQEFVDIHKDVIMDVAEIPDPLVIATACIDKMVRLISLKEKKVVGIFSGHLKGVRQIQYTSYQDGFMVSVGYESYANIWTLEGGMGAIQSTINLVKEDTAQSSLHGKFNNYGNLFRIARFLPNSPFCVTVDEKFVCKIFNFLTMKTMQIIQPRTRGNSEINDILVVANLQRFAIVSKRLLFYDIYGVHHLKDKRMAQNLANQPSLLGGFKKPNMKIQEKIMPIIGADYNLHSGNFVVCTTNEIRQYCGATGQLLKIFSDVLDSRSRADIKCFTFCSRGRKIILGDAEGTVRQLNLTNGVQIMLMSNRNDQVFEVKRAEGISKDKNREVNQIASVSGYPSNDINDDDATDEAILITSSWDNKVCVYDEKDNVDEDWIEDEPYEKDQGGRNPEKQKVQDKLVVRKLNGVNLGDQVVCMAVSKHHSLIATGNAFGQVITWDLETAKILQVHIAVADQRVTLLQFLEKYPILVCGGSEGQVSLWATRGAPAEYRYDCLGRFKNVVREPESPQNLLNLGISCGVVQVLKIKYEHKIFQSDHIHYDKTCFTQQVYKTEEDIEQFGRDLELIIPRTKAQGAFDNSGLTETNSITKLKRSILEAKNKLTRAQPQSTLGVEDTYDRALCVVGTDAGYIQIWDFTYQTTSDAAACLDTDRKDRGRIESPPSANPKRKDSNEKKRKPEVEMTFLVNREEQRAQLIRLAKVDQPLGETQENYNPLRKVITKIDPASANSFVQKARKDFDDIERAGIKYPVLNVLENIELRFYKHNAFEFIQQETKIETDDKSSEEQSAASYENIIREEQQSQPGSQTNSIRRENYQDKVFKSKRKFCRGLLKAHDMAVNSLKVIMYNEKCMFISTSDDRKVKIFSLQVASGGPVHVQIYGQIDMHNTTQTGIPWAFPFDNNEIIQKQKVQFKKTLKQIFDNDLKYSNHEEDHTKHIKIAVVDPRKDRLDRARDLQKLKAEQLNFREAIVTKQVTFMDKEKIAEKFDEMRDRKIKMQLKKLAKSQSQQVLGLEDQYQPVFKKFSMLQKEKKNKEQREHRDMKSNSPTKLNIQQFDVQEHERLFNESIGTLGVKKRKEGDKGPQQNSTTRTSHEQRQIKAKQDDKQVLNKYIQSVMYHDQEELPFTKKEQMLAAGEFKKFKEHEKQANRQTQANESLTFHESRKKWFLGVPERSGIHQKSIDQIGTQNIEKITHSKQMEKAVQEQQKLYGQSFADMEKQRQLAEAREEAELEKRKLLQLGDDHAASAMTRTRAINGDLASSPSLTSQKSKKPALKKKTVENRSLSIINSPNHRIGSQRQQGQTTSSPLFPAVKIKETTSLRGEVASKTTGTSRPKLKNLTAQLEMARRLSEKPMSQPQIPSFRKSTQDGMATQRFSVNLKSISSMAIDQRTPLPKTQRGITAGQADLASRGTSRDGRETAAQSQTSKGGESRFKSGNGRKLSIAKQRSALEKSQPQSTGAQPVDIYDQMMPVYKDFLRKAIVDMDHLKSSVEQAKQTQLKDRLKPKTQNASSRESKLVLVEKSSQSNRIPTKAQPTPQNLEQDQLLRVKYLHKPSQHQKVNGILEQISDKYKDQIEKRNLSHELASQFERAGGAKTSRSATSLQRQLQAKGMLLKSQSKGQLKADRQVADIIGQVFGDFNIKDQLAEQRRLNKAAFDKR